jgi:hypothetical protein
MSEEFEIKNLHKLLSELRETHPNAFDKTQSHILKVIEKSLTSKSTNLNSEVMENMKKNTKKADDIGNPDYKEFRNQINNIFE